MGLSVQFYGLDSVMNAAEARNCTAWGIFIGRNLFMKYEGQDMNESIQVLQTHLEALQASNTQAVYTIKFFENPKGDLKINERTVCDGGSFNFKLIEPEEREMRSVGYQVSTQTNNRILELLEKMNERITAIESKDDDDDDDEPEKIGDVIRELAENPDKVFNLINYGRAILGMPAHPYSAAVGSITNNTTTTMTDEQQQQFTDQEQQERLQRLSNALTILEKHDKSLLEHLEKLADMAEHQTMKFKMLIGML
jgi:hypothetical protein